MDRTKKICISLDTASHGTWICIYIDIAYIVALHDRFSSVQFNFYYMPYIPCLSKFDNDVSCSLCAPIDYWVVKRDMPAWFESNETPATCKVTTPTMWCQDTLYCISYTLFILLLSKIRYIIWRCFELYVLILFYFSFHFISHINTIHGYNCQSFFQPREGSFFPELKPDWITSGCVNLWMCRNGCGTTLLRGRGVARLFI
jgi:hypothetical protein